MAKKPDFKALANRAAKRNDQTQTKTGGGDFTPPPAGTTTGRFVDYIEVGLQKQRPYKGKEKPPANKVYVTFELLGKNYIKEIEVDGKKKEIADRITVPLTLSLHEKSSFKKLFKKMTYGRQDIEHMAQMLGEAFKITVKHNEVGEGDKKKVYANITDDDGNFLISAPVRKEEDEEGNVIGTKKLAVRDSLSNERLFIWDEPTQETWDSLFIDGDREVKDEKGKTKTVSKNWIQNMITSALNFEGSPIQAFLEGSDSLPDDPEELEDDSEEVEDEDLEEEVDDEDVEDDAEEEVEEDEVEDEEEVEEDEVEEEVEEAPKTTTKAKAAAKPTAKQQLAAKKAEAKAPAKTAKAAKAPAKVAGKKKAAVAQSDDPLAALGLV